MLQALNEKKRQKRYAESKDENKKSGEALTPPALREPPETHKDAANASAEPAYI